MALTPLQPTPMATTAPTALTAPTAPTPAATAGAPAALKTLHATRAPQPHPYRQPVNTATVTGELIPRLQIHAWQNFFRIFVTALSRYLQAHRVYFGWGVAPPTSRGPADFAFRAAITDFDLTFLHAHGRNLAAAEAIIAAPPAETAAFELWLRGDMELVHAPLDRLVIVLAEMTAPAGNVNVTGHPGDDFESLTQELWMAYFAAAAGEGAYYMFLRASHGMHAAALSYAAGGRAVRCALNTAVDAEIESAADLETPLWAVLREFLACAGVRGRRGRPCRCLQTVVLA